jgi:glutathione S-transferase
MLNSYTAGTPNGHKVHIAFEELGLHYNVHKIDISKNIQKEEWFLKICRTLFVPTFPVWHDIDEQKTD